jgi:sec-independent protein translocase protein TatB
VFDIGTGEFIALAILALLVLGPEKLPRYAADAARFLRQIRTMANEARTEVTKELGPELEGLNFSELNPRALMRKHLLDGLDDDQDDNASSNGRRSNGGSTNGSPSNGRGASSPRSPGAAPEPRSDATYDPDTT